ncbi:helix-turn-helix domain-containing protein [Mesorhizobium sp. ANAO-SY3R2]|uniref:AraC-like ligand-binding domain-containing protein n=1 Tax=Mesorhizobium sp. ANAO-SY3R2 TaxID=3166644 RepID=UPI00366C2102
MFPPTLSGADQRTDYWRSVTRPLFDTMPDDSGLHPSLEGAFSTRMIGPMMVGYANFNPQRYNRDRRIVSHSGLEDFYLVQLFTEGTCLADCEGTRMSITAGDVYIFDMGRTFTASVGAGSTLSVILRREQLDRVAGGRSLHGIQFKADQPLTRLLADFIIGLTDVAPVLDEIGAPALEDAAVALLASALQRSPSDTALQDPALTHVLRRRVLDFIDANLAEPELGPVLLMHRFRVSRAHLYRMFAADGGVAKVVRERRLDASYRVLVRPDASSRSITDIAYRFGFSGSSQFLRAFRARFDMTPSEARQEAAQPAMTDQRLAQVQARFAEYAQQLGVVDRIG